MSEITLFSIHIFVEYYHSISSGMLHNTFTTWSWPFCSFNPINFIVLISILPCCSILTYQLNSLYSKCPCSIYLCLAVLLIQNLFLGKLPEERWLTPSRWYSIKESQKTVYKKSQLYASQGSIDSQEKSQSEGENHFGKHGNCHLFKV